MKRLRQLDALRGLAAISVVLFHYTWWYDFDVAKHTPGLIARFFYGRYGVELFFIISGFVILMTLERSRGILAFAVSRFGRLYPAYATCSAITLGVIVFAHFNPNHITLAKALVSMTMMSQLVQWPPIDLSYWTLTYEVLFYIGAAALYLGMGVRRIEIPSLAWLAVSAAGRMAHLASMSHRSGVLLDFTYASLFVIGMMIYRIASGRASALTYATVALAFAVLLLPPQWLAPGGPMPMVVYVPMVACFALAAWAAAAGRLRALEWRPLLFLGDISYSLYLIHQLVGFWIIRHLELAGTDPNLAILAAIAAAIALAAAVRTLVERPAQQAIRGAYAARQPRAATAAA